MQLNLPKNQSGFSVMELLISAAVFSIIAMTGTGIFARAVILERKAFSAQTVQDNALNVLGIMSKELRTANVTSANSPCSATNLNFTVIDSGGLTKNGAYNLNTSTGMVERQYDGQTYSISSDDVVFNSLSFCIANTGIDDIPTRVTIIARISNKNNPNISARIQTTITSRDINVELQN